MSKSNLEVNKEFDEQFPSNQLGGFDPIYRDGGRKIREGVKKFINELRLSDRTAIVEEIRSWAEEARKMVGGEGLDVLADLEQYLNTLL